MNHIRASFALSKFGDSHNCMPGDLFQEGGIDGAKMAATQVSSNASIVEDRVLVSSAREVEKARRHNHLNQQRNTTDLNPVAHRELLPTPNSVVHYSQAWL